MNIPAELAAVIRSTATEAQEVIKQHRYQLPAVVTIRELGEQVSIGFRFDPSGRLACGQLTSDADGNMVLIAAVVTDQHIVRLDATDCMM